MRNKPEVLAPAGSYESFKAAICSGCDAIYTGGMKFGARAYAGNFDEDQMIEAIDYAHINNVKVYMTTNTLLKNNEIKSEFVHYLRPYYEAGLDAVIVQDMGLANLIHNVFSDIDIHISTQAGFATHLSANELKKSGITRVVPPRELSLNELKMYRENTDLELEVFTHGALCYCFSGQCYMSSFLGGRSGNRGRCAQPCRKKYHISGGKSGYILSPKDICTISLIPQLIETGIDSFKIEGRMKKPEYVAICTKMYRKYIDIYCDNPNEYDAYIIEHEKEYQDDLRKLSDIYNRGGFSKGYFECHNGKEMMSLKRPNHFGTYSGIVTQVTKGGCTIKTDIPLNSHDVLEIRGTNQNNSYEFTLGADHVKQEEFFTRTLKGIKIFNGEKVYRIRNQKLIDELKSVMDNGPDKLEVIINCECVIDKNVTLSMKYNDFEYNVSGDKVGKAKTNPVDSDRIKKQLSKLGNTVFKAKDIVVVCDKDIFISMGELNNLKRSCAKGLMNMIIKSFHRNNNINKYSPDLCYTCANKENVYAGYNGNENILNILIHNPMVKGIYIDISQNNDIIRKHVTLIKKYKKKCIFVLPTIVRYNLLHEIKTIIQFCEKLDTDGLYMAGSMDGVILLMDMLIERSRIIAGPSLYTFNDYSIAFINKFCGNHSIPYELSLNEIADFYSKSGIMQVYGAIPVMTSVQCVRKNTTKCNQNNDIIKFSEEDNFYIAKSMCRFCQSVIYNEKRINYINNLSIIMENGIKDFYLNFINESEDEVKKILLSVERIINREQKVTTNKGIKEGYLDYGVL